MNAEADDGVCGGSKYISASYGKKKRWKERERMREKDRVDCCTENLDYT